MSLCLYLVNIDEYVGFKRKFVFQYTWGKRVIVVLESRRRCLSRYAEEGTSEVFRR